MVTVFFFQEYRKAVSQLGYGHFKSRANEWMLPEMRDAKLMEIDMKIFKFLYNVFLKIAVSIF